MSAVPDFASMMDLFCGVISTDGGPLLWSHFNRSSRFDTLASKHDSNEGFFLFSRIVGLKSAIYIAAAVVVVGAAAHLVRD